MLVRTLFLFLLCAPFGVVVADPPPATKFLELTGEAREEALVRAEYDAGHKAFHGTDTSNSFSVPAAVARYLVKLVEPTAHFDKLKKAPSIHRDGELYYHLYLYSVNDARKDPALSADARRVMEELLILYSTGKQHHLSVEIVKDAVPYLTQGEKEIPLVVATDDKAPYVIRYEREAQSSLRGWLCMTKEERDAFEKKVHFAGEEEAVPLALLKQLEDLARETKHKGEKGTTAFDRLFPHDKKFWVPGDSYFSRQPPAGHYLSETETQAMLVLARKEENAPLVDRLEALLLRRRFGLHEDFFVWVSRYALKEKGVTAKLVKPAPARQLPANFLYPAFYDPSLDAEPPPVAEWYDEVGGLGLEEWAERPAAPQSVKLDPLKKAKDYLPDAQSGTSLKEVIAYLKQANPANRNLKDPNAHIVGPPSIVASIRLTRTQEILAALIAQMAQEEKGKVPTVAAAAVTPSVARPPQTVIVAAPPAATLAPVDSTVPRPTQQARPAVAPPTDIPLPESVESTEPARPLTPEEIAAQAAYQEKSAFLENVRKALKKDFDGIDDIIDELMTIAENLELHPELVQKPPIVRLLGLNGGGKTSVIQVWAALMGWDNRFHHQRVKDNAPFLITDGLRTFSREITGSETEADAHVPGATGVVFIDDLQKLMGKAAFELFAAGDSTLQNKRTVHHDRLWQIQGNGTLSLSAAGDAQALINSLKEKADELASNQVALRRIAEETATIKGTAALDKTPVTSRLTAIEDLAAQLQSANAALETAIKGLFESIKKINKGLLGKYMAVSAPNFFATLKDGPGTVFEEIEAALETVPLDSRYDFRHTVFVYAANPIQLLGPTQEFVVRTLRETGRPASLSQIRAFVAHLQSEAVGAFFAEKFGDDPGWASRFQVGHTKVMLPPDEAEVRLKVQRRFGRVAAALNKGWGKLGLRYQLQFEGSVHQLMMQILETDPLNFSRFLYGDSLMIFGSLFTDLDRPLIARTVTEGTLHVTYDPTTKELVVLDKNKKTVLRKKANLNLPLYDDKREGINYESLRQRYHQAGHVAMGTLVYGSLPRSISRNATGTDISRPEFWEQPNVDLYEATANRILIHLAGYAAEDLFTDPARTSTAAQADHREAIAEMDRLMASLREKSGRESFRGATPLPLREVIPASLRTHPLFKILAETDGDTSKALKYALALSRKALHRHHDYVLGVFTALAEKESLNKDELAAILRQCTSFPGRQARDLLRTTSGLFTPVNCREALVNLESDAPHQGWMHSFLRWYYLRKL